MIDNDNRIRCFPRNIMLLFLLKSINFVIFYKSYRGTGYKIIIVNLSFGKEREKERERRVNLFKNFIPLRFYCRRYTRSIVGSRDTVNFTRFFLTLFREFKEFIIVPATRLESALSVLRGEGEFVVFSPFASF